MNTLDCKRTAPFSSMRLVILIAASVALVIGGVLVHEPKLNKNVAMKKLFELGQNEDMSIRSLACTTCTIFVDGLQLLIKQNRTDEELESFIKLTCKKLNVEQPYVCDHLIDMFAPEIIFVLQRVIFTPAEICGAFIQNCGHSVDPLAVMWKIPIPDGKPPVKPWPVVQKGRPTMRVLHLSDIHIDRNYAVGSEADCTDGEGLDKFGTYALCCRNYPPTQRERELKAVKQPAGKWGSAWTCDIPWRTFESVLKHINKTEKNLDYVIITGDYEAHDMWDYTKEKTKDLIGNVTEALRKYLPNVPIYQAIGNHEGVPMDAMPPHDMESYDLHSPEWLYETLADNWKPLSHSMMSKTAVADMKYRGSYIVYPKPGLKLISINTVYCSEFNFFLYIDQVDPDGTLQWFIDQLLDSESKGEKVHIISHIPSGADYCLKGWAFNFYDIVNRFENTITGQFYGHTHYDHFQVFYENANPKGRPTHFNFITPSVTTYDFSNPSYRIYTIDGAYQGSSFTTIEAETYYTNVTKANIDNHEPIWELEYTTKKAYGMKDFSPESWNDLINRMEKNTTLFGLFHLHYRRHNYESWCPHDKLCVRKFTCNMRTARAHDQDTFCP